MAVTFKQKVARRAKGYIVFAVIGAGLGLVVARFATFFAEHGGVSVQSLITSSNLLAGDLMARPTHIDFGCQPVAIAFAATLAIMLFLAFAAASKGEKLDNEDTGAEHGDDRLATERETKSLADRKYFCNNVLLSENCHMAMKPHDKRTSAVLDGRNLNCITLGISGLGKTYNLVWPDLMQSVGDALEPARYGIWNVPGHFRASRAYRILMWVRKQVASAMQQEGKGERRKERKDARRQAEKAAEDVPRKKTHVVYGNLYSRFCRIVPEELSRKAKDVVADYREDVGAKETRAEKRAKAAASITGGYDVFNSDPKGDNVRDVGPMYERAGYDIKVVNTIDFRDGLHFNPLAYIKTHAVDARNAEETRIRVTVSAPSDPSSAPVDIRLGQAEEDYQLAPGASKEVGAGGEPIIGSVPTGTMWTAAAKYNLTTERWGSGELPAITEGREELNERLETVMDAIGEAGKANDTARVLELSTERDVILEQINVWWMQHEMGDYTQDDGESGDEAHVEKLPTRGVGKGCSKVKDALAAYTYKRSSGTVEVEFKNFFWQEIGAEVTIELDDSLIVDGVLEETCGEIEWPTNEYGETIASGTLVWRLPGVEPKNLRKRGKHGVETGPLKPEECVQICERLVLHVHIRTEFVADGVDLTKVVDCLVANLRGTDAKSNGSEDPFWEDTKRLCFMSLVALTFERYGPEHRTLPEVMRLLDMALPDEGNPEAPSPLKCLMEMWEYGRVYSAEPAETASGRYAAHATSWKKAANVSHSRNNSLALHCYHAFMNGAPETVQSVIISCQACLVNLVTDDVKEFLSYDELALDTLGDPDKKQVIFCVTKDTNSPFDFLTALIVYLAIDLAQDKAYKVYGGKLPRHVRFVLDEAANIGKIPILIRALAVVRSRNISISMYLQSKAQLALVYGEKEADVIFDNCTTIVYLGAQTEETREEMSKKVGNETVQTRRFQRSFNAGSVVAGSASESISSNERRVMSASKMGKLEKGYLMLFIFNMPGAIFDHKFKTRRHPYYAYINPGDKRSLLEPMPRVEERFDYMEYLKRRREKEAEMSG